MAVNPFVYQNMQNNNSIQLANDGIQSYQQRLSDQAKSMNEFGNTLGRDLENIKDESNLRANTDADGNMDEAGYIKTTALQSPLYALQLKNQYDAVRLNNAKISSEVAKNNAAASADASTKQMNNIKTSQGVITGVANQISQSTPETWDAAVGNAKKMAGVYGLELPDAFSEGYSPEKKQLAMQMAMSQKERIDADHQSLQDQLDGIKTGNDTQRTNTSTVKSMADIDQGQQSINISAQNAASTAQNAATGVANATTSRMNAENDKVEKANARNQLLSKSYATDTDDFAKAKQAYIDLKGISTVKLQKTDNATQLAKNLLNQIEKDPSIIGSLSAKVGAGITSTTGISTESNNFKQNLGQIASNFNLDAMKQMKGNGSISDADMRMISAAGGLNPDSGKSSSEYAKSLREFIKNAELSNKADNDSLSNMMKSLKDKSDALKKKYK